MTPSGALPSFKNFQVMATRGSGALIATKFMTVRSFFDTNVVIYSDDKSAPAKQQRALELLSQHRRAGTADTRC